MNESKTKHEHTEEIICPYCTFEYSKSLPVIKEVIEKRFDKMAENCFFGTRSLGDGDEDNVYLSEISDEMGDNKGKNKLLSFIISEITKALDDVVPYESNFERKALAPGFIAEAEAMKLGWNNCRQEVLDKIKEILKDSIQLEDEGEIECLNCKEKFYYRVVVEQSYSTEKI